MHNTLKHTGRVFAGLLALFATASSAWAQNAPPQPALTRNQPAWVGIVIMIVMVVIVVFASLMSSKRSHQD